MTDTVVLVLAGIAAAAAVGCLIAVLAKQGETARLERALNAAQAALSRQMEVTSRQSAELLSGAQQQSSQSQTALLEAMTRQNTAQLAQMEERLRVSLAQMEERMERMRQGVEQSMTAMRQENEKQLGEIRTVTEEKLEKTLQSRIGESFREVSDRLEQVYKGLGEMQTLAAGVGDLKRVLSNVKTRGILGEVQLGAILEEILSPEQYETNVMTRKNSGLRVEYAVRLPGENGAVYLPIDAKFPAEPYAAMQTAYDAGDAAGVEAAAAQFTAELRRFARDIRDKYIDPPATTEFGVLFLPFEGLYAEAVRRGLVEVLQREYRITLAGPTTMAALLNSLQMGFRTLAIQKRSAEVWKVLGAVRTEFDKFGDALEAAQKRLEQTGTELDKLVGVRTRQIQAKLRSVTALPETESQVLLGENEVRQEL